MALTIDQLNSLTKKHIAPRIADNLFDAVPLLARLRGSRNEVFTGGVSIDEPIIFQDTGQAGGFIGDGPLPTVSQENVTSASFQIVQYQVPIVISESQIMRNTGPNGVMKLMNVIEQVARLDLQNVLGGDLFTGNSVSVDAAKLDGLDLMVDDDDTPKAYGGISTSDFAGWAADDGSGFGAPSLANLQGVIGDVTFGTDRPTLMVVTQNIYDKVWSLLQADQRFAQEKEGDAGFRFLNISGIPMIVDPNTPASVAVTSETMYFLNEKYIFWYTHKDVNMQLLPFQRPENAWNRIAHIITMHQLVTNRRKAHARRTGVDATL